MTKVQALGSVLAARFDGDGSAAPAIQHRGRSISYTELAAAAESIADQLASLDLKKGAHIGVLADDDSLIVPALIAIIARGFVFTLLDPSYPANYLRELVDAADLVCVLVEDSLQTVAAEAVQSKTATILPINACIYASPSQCYSISTLLGQTAERALYIYFSSGTSGDPKPVLGRADSLMHFVNWEISALGLDSTIRVSQLTSPSHDPYLRDVFTPLVAGGTVCIPDSKHVVLSPFELGRWIDDTGIHLVHCTPTVFRNLCNGGITGRTFSELQYVLIAGEQLRGVHLAAWYKAFGDRVKLVNLYGPTETTLAKLFYFISPDDVDRPAVPIGQPINGTEVRIVAAQSRECNVGEIGELYIETRFGTLGYYRKPGHNLESFQPDPSTSLDCPVIYKTGDLVKRLPDGNIEFVGRNNGQQKLRGKQIDLGRVEDEIVERTEVDSCVVSVMTTGEGTEHLVAYYAADREADEQLLKRQLTRDLPKYMIPDIWIRVDSLPTNTNGKVHSSELAALLSKHESGRLRRDSPISVEPAGTESRLLQLWKELLRNDAVGLDDPFMEAGGDSLSIMLLIARLDQEYVYNLSLWEVFDSLTIRKLASLIDGAVGTADTATGPAVPARN